MTFEEAMERPLSERQAELLSCIKGGLWKARQGTCLYRIGVFLFILQVRSAGLYMTWSSPGFPWRREDEAATSAAEPDWDRLALVAYSVACTGQKPQLPLAVTAEQAPQTIILACGGSLGRPCVDSLFRDCACRGGILRRGKLPA